MDDDRIVTTVRVNDVLVEREVPARLLLSDFLRDECRLTGVHVGCEHGVCGACTVMLDGVAVRSCLMFAVQSDGCEIRTVEGLASPAGTLHRLQESFSRNLGLQCGFCTPGMLMSAMELLGRDEPPTREDITSHLSGNLCRCTGYIGIVDAIVELVGDADTRPLARSSSTALAPNEGK